MAFYPNERIAMFIDGSNLYSTVKHLDFDIDYQKMLTLFREKGRLIRANYYTALVEEADYAPIRPLVDWLDYNGYHCITKPAIFQVDRDGRRHTKGNMDAEMIVDMLQMAPHIDHYIIFTGDGDFRASVEAVQKQGVRVTVVSSRVTKPPMLADELRRQCDDFIEISEMDKIFGRPKSGQKTSRSEDD